MVAENSDIAIGTVVGEQLVSFRRVWIGTLVELLLKDPGCVVGTKDLCSEALHVLLEVIVEHACLRGMSIATTLRVRAYSQAVK